MSVVPWSLGAVRRSSPVPGSRTVQGETLLLSHSLGRTGERVEGSQGVPSDGKAGFTLEDPPSRLLEKGRQEKRAFPCSKICNFCL